MIVPRDSVYKRSEGIGNSVFVYICIQSFCYERYGAGLMWPLEVKPGIERAVHSTTTLQMASYVSIPSSHDVEIILVSLSDFVVLSQFTLVILWIMKFLWLILYLIISALMKMEQRAATRLTHNLLRDQLYCIQVRLLITVTGGNRFFTALTISIKHRLLLQEPLQYTVTSMYLNYFTNCSIFIYKYLMKRPILPSDIVTQCTAYVRLRTTEDQSVWGPLYASSIMLL